MKINVAFYISTKGISGDGLDYPEKGNPGIGATPYLFVLIASQLNKKYKASLNIFFYTDSNIKLPNDIKKVIVSDEFEAVKTAKKTSMDLLIIRTTTNFKIYDYIESLNQPVITWSHNRIWSNTADAIANNSFIKRNICVGVRQSLELIDHDIYNKTNVIFNPIIVNLKNARILEQPTVTYIGHLEKQRGFHVLAKIWKSVLKKVPNAKLNVIGSAALYNRNTKLGPLNVSSENYERRFKKYITDKEGKLLPSVRFYGILGKEKEDIYKGTTVGVINPLGYETLGLSGIEMEACGVPLVSINKFGQSEIIKHNFTGYLFNNHREFKKYIIELLQNEDKNIQFGENARNFVIEKFDLEKILDQWHTEFYDIVMDRQIKKDEIEISIKPIEKLRLLNAKIKRHKTFRWLPSILNLQSKIRSSYHFILRKKFIK